MVTKNLTLSQQNTISLSAHLQHLLCRLLLGVGRRLCVGGARTLHGIRTLTPVVGGVVAVANGDDIASGNWKSTGREGAQ